MLSPEVAAELYGKARNGYPISNKELKDLMDFLSVMRAFMREAGERFAFPRQELDQEYRRLQSYKTERKADDEVLRITIKSVGACQVVGGVEFQPENLPLTKFIITDDSGAKELYHIFNGTAIWYGSLNGTEQQRFDGVGQGRKFFYRRKEYKRLSMRTVRDIVSARDTYELQPGFDVSRA